MNYLEFKLTITPVDPWKEIITAGLSDCGFESFVDEGENLVAYISEQDYKEQVFNEFISGLSQEVKVSWEKKTIESQNWNAIWESGFSPVKVGNKCLVRAPFHEEDPNVEIEIVIEPKMSFGTGHHDTTFLMLEKLLETEVSGKEILDMGCGTGILAIAAFKRNAGHVMAIDNNENAYLNCLENCEDNNCSGILVNKGDSALLAGRSFHGILANINRNVLLADLSSYVNCLKDEGFLFISGFFETDIPQLQSAAEQYGLQKTDQKVRNSWAMLAFKKQ